jgi:ATP-dependent DNA ligase
VPGAVSFKHPGFIKAQLATLRDAVPTNAGWVFEIKFDRYRMQASKREAKASILTRSGLN